MLPRYPTEHPKGTGRYVLVRGISSLSLMSALMENSPKKASNRGGINLIVSGTNDTSSDRGVILIAFKVPSTMAHASSLLPLAG
jgi:hypothetical protein